MPETGRVVLLTGAGGGIGVQILRQLVEAGYRVAFVERDEAALKRAEAVIPAGSGAFGAVVDAANLDQVTTFVSDATPKLGPFFGLVNSAGFFNPERFEDSTPMSWQEAISANLLTQFCTCRVLLPEMRMRRQGSVVNFASTAGEYGSIRPAAAYAAAKGGVIGLTKSLAREFSPDNVRVNAISPGPTNTPAFQFTDDASRKVAASRTLFNRVGEPSDIANGVLFLLSDQSSWITGTVLQVNGGSLL
jgi:NAD(P)-dependent dehydrogenase (short-subunit alcohol dehydrogenase family)